MNAFATHFRTRRYHATAMRTGDPGLERRVDDVLTAWTGSQRIVGAVVLVARAGRLVDARAAGWADREAGVPAADHTIFRLASSTKLIVSAAALALIERGQLSLDDEADRWLPYFRPRLANGRRPTITIRHLLTHTAGLSYAFLEPEDRRYQETGVAQGLAASEGSLEEHLRRLASVPLFYAPGTEWRYSLATDVLGAVVAKAADMPLGDALERWVTGPLGMSHTAFVAADRDRLSAAYVDAPTANADLAAGPDTAPCPRLVINSGAAGEARRMNDDADVLPLGTGATVSPRRAIDRNADPSGGGGLVGTAADYLRLLEAIRSGGRPLFSPRSAAALTSHCIGPLRAWTEGEGWGFGLGAAVLLDPITAGTPQGVGTWQWGGALGSHWFVDPTRELTVVVMTNTGLAGVIGPFPTALRDAIYAPDSARR